MFKIMTIVWKHGCHGGVRLGTAMSAWEPSCIHPLTWPHSMSARLGDILFLMTLMSESGSHMCGAIEFGIEYKTIAGNICHTMRLMSTNWSVPPVAVTDGWEWFEPIIMMGTNWSPGVVLYILGACHSFDLTCSQRVSRGVKMWLNCYYMFCIFRPCARS